MTSLGLLVLVLLDRSANCAGTRECKNDDTFGGKYPRYYISDWTVTLGSTSKTNGFVFSYFFAETFKVCLEVSFFEYYHPKSHN